MEIAILIIFIIGYIAITLEHSIKVDKLVPALLMMVLAWTCVAIGIDGFDTWFDSTRHGLMNGSHGTLNFPMIDHKEKMNVLHSSLLHHFGKTCEILIFLIGAMTIVEMIDHFNGFATIKRFIKTTRKRKLLWIISILAFVLSAIIDNLTATIVLITILRKILTDSKDRMWFAGMIIIAANAGGAWSPIGDVTTTMLWIGEKVSTVKLVEYLIAPSLFCMIVPTLIAGYLKPFKGNFTPPSSSDKEENKHGPIMLYSGLGMIVFVPIFKTITHLPPYLGMMLSLSVIALMAEWITARKYRISQFEENFEENENHHHSPTFGALSKIEMPSILFFLGILMTVAALESVGMVLGFGNSVQNSMAAFFGDLDIGNNFFILLLGVASAIIDNVPLVAASMGMFDVDTYSTDSYIWHFIAYTAGTGGSMLIIGSAAGVVAMGMEKISFFWYLRKIGWLAMLGYLTGAGSFLLIEHYFYG